MLKHLNQLRVAAAGICWLALSAAAGPRYTVTDLGSLGGGISSAMALNASGQVVGESRVGSLSHAFLYSGGQMYDLGALEEGKNSVAYAINDAGWVAGYSKVTGPSPGRAFLYDGAMYDLGTLNAGATYSFGLGINNNGTVVGSSDFYTPAGHTVRAFSYAAGSMTNLGEPLDPTCGNCGLGSVANDINDSGLVTGYAALKNGLVRAYLYDTVTGLTTELGSIGGPAATSRGQALNNRGEVTGWGNPTNLGVTHAFLYSGGTMHDLGGLDPNPNYVSEGFGINNFGVVVGYAGLSTGAGHAFIYSGGSMTDLNTLIPADSNWILNEARGINDAGQIVGTGHVGSAIHAYLLTPVPEPETAVLMLAGLAWFGWEWQRRHR